MAAGLPPIVFYIDIKEKHGIYHTKQRAHGVRFSPWRNNGRTPGGDRDDQQEGFFGTGPRSLCEAARLVCNRYTIG